MKITDEMVAACVKAFKDGAIANNKRVKIKGVEHICNPVGRYALYLHKSGEWRESARVTNEMLEAQRE